MKIVRGGEMAWGESLVAHRGGNVQHKLLFAGKEGSPDNFQLALAKEGNDFFSPRHRHAFDQVRLCLEGAVPIGRRMSVDAGEVAYFPEGVPYGPQEGGGKRIELLLQFGGASGLGYLSARQLKGAHEALARDGVFEDGVYTRDGKNTDAHAALWRQVTGAELVYPAPRYKTPIIIRAENFPWEDSPDGGREKFLGLFYDRGLVLQMVSIAAGSAWKGPSFFRAPHLLFVVTGEGRCAADTYSAHTTFRLETDEACTLEATTDTEVFVIGVQPLTRSSGSP